MQEEPLPQQLVALTGLLAEMDARLSRAPVAPVGLEDLKQSVDALRTSMWAILSAGHGTSAPVRVERLKLRRAIDGIRAIDAHFAADGKDRRYPEHAELERVARALADRLAAPP